MINEASPVKDLKEGFLTFTFLSAFFRLVFLDGPPVPHPGGFLHNFE